MQCRTPSRKFARRKHRAVTQPHRITAALRQRSSITQRHPVADIAAVVVIAGAAVVDTPAAAATVVAAVTAAAPHIPRPATPPATQAAAITATNVASGRGFVLNR